MKKVSIIIPVYNAEKYIKKCLESVMNQDYRNIEILVVNDGSTDSSLEIIHDLAACDARIMVFNKENGGAGSALNVGIENATGDYFMFVDNDDWVEFDIVSFLVKKIEEYQLDLAICSGVDEYESTGKTVSLKRHGDCFFDSHQAIKDILSDHQFTHEAMMKKLYKRNIIEDIRLIDSRNFQDTYIFFKIIDNCHRIGYFDEEKYHYLFRQGSMTHNGYKKYSIEQLYAYTDNYDFIEEKYPESLSLLEHNIVSVSMFNYMRIFAEKLEKEYDNDLNVYRKYIQTYKPMFKWSFSKVVLYGMWNLFKINEILFSAFLKCVFYFRRKRVG